MFDGYGCPNHILKDVSVLKNLLRDIPARLEMHTICDAVVVEVGPNNRKDPGGLSGFVMIAESHISIHTFPMRGFLSADVYSCQNDLDTDRLKKIFVETFEASSCEVHLQQRGRYYPDSDIYK